MKFIFKIKIKEGHTEREYIDAWKSGSAIIQKSLGARGTRLHRTIDEPGVLVAIAEWESKELRDTAIQRLEQDPLTSGAINRHEEFAEIEVLGNIEEIERVDPQ